MPAPQFDLYLRPVPSKKVRYRCLLLKTNEGQTPSLPARGEEIRLRLGPVTGHFLPFQDLPGETPHKLPAIEAREASEGWLTLCPFAKLAGSGEPTDKVVSALQGQKEPVLGLFLAYCADARSDGGNGLLAHYLGARARRNDAQLVLLASECVFEIETSGSVVDWLPADHQEGCYLVEDRLTVGGASAALRVHVAVSGTARFDPVSIAAQQTQDGVELTIRNPPQDKSIDPAKHWVRLHRAEGLIPPPELPMLRAYLLGGLDPQHQSGDSIPAVSPIRIVDPIPAGALVGKQVHYRVDVVNLTGQVRCSGSVTLLRERMDPPRPPREPRATLDATGSRSLIRIRFGLPDPAGGAPEPLDALTIDVYAEERELDECGYYGDDDDQALWESLIEADLDYDPEAAAEKPAWSPRSLAGRFDRDGLQEVATVRGADLTKFEGNEAELKLGESPTDDLPWLRRGRGYRLHVGISRTVLAGAPPRSVLSRCRHELLLKRTSESGTPPVPQPVFQLERFWDSLPTGKGRALPCDRWEAAIVPGDSKTPTTVSIQLQHPSAGAQPAPAETVRSAETSPADAIPLGGYRIWWRDVVAQGEPARFFATDTFAVLPDHIASYQPVQLECGGGWAGIWSRLLNPKTNPTEGPTDSKATGPDRLHRLETWLQNALPVTKKPFRLRGAEFSGSTGDSVSATSEKSHPRFEFLLDFDASQAGGSAQDPYHWVIHARVLTVLRELGYTRDLVVKKWALPQLHEWLKNVPETNAFDPQKIGFRCYVVIGQCDGIQKVPLATVRLAVLPEPGHPFYEALATPQKETHLERNRQKLVEALGLKPKESDKSGTESAKACLAESAPGILLMLLTDRSPAPRYVTMDAQRRVELPWNELTDLWHHDLEFIVERLSRYERLGSAPVREPAAPAAAPAREAEPDWPSQESEKRAVVVPRRQELKDKPFLLPVMHRLQTRVAFQILDTRERFAAAASVLSRVRSGVHFVHLSPRFRRRAEDESRYRRLPPVDLAALKPSVSTQLSKEALDLQGAARWYVQPADTEPTNPCQRYFCELVTSRTESWLSGEGDPTDQRLCLPGGEEAIVPVTHADVVEIPHAPYYLEYELEAWLSADGVKGPSSKAVQSRRPAGLGLVRCPSVVWMIEEGQEDTRRLEIELWPSLLGSHLTKQEWAQSEWMRKKQPDWHCQPDLDLVYHFWINVGDESQIKLQPFLSIDARPREDDKKPPNAAWSNCCQYDNYERKKEEKIDLRSHPSGKLGVTISIPVLKSHPLGQVLVRLDETISAEPVLNFLFLTLERGSQQTPRPLPLPLEISRY